MENKKKINKKMMWSVLFRKMTAKESQQQESSLPSICIVQYHISLPGLGSLTNANWDLVHGK